MFCSLAIDTSRVDGESRIDIGLICLPGPEGNNVHMLEVGAIRGSQYYPRERMDPRRSAETLPNLLRHIVLTV